MVERRLKKNDIEEYRRLNRVIKREIRKAKESERGEVERKLAEKSKNYCNEDLANLIKGVIKKIGRTNFDRH